MRSKHQADGPLRYRFGPGTRVTEVYPETCKNGHPHEPGKVTKGWSTPFVWICCDRCRAEGLPNDTTYLLPPPHEEVMRQWREWNTQQQRGHGKHL
ncbi:hypothetical protein [Kibdelosporangium phytohabitans]|uniref:hypothetical protein n=1 Tax=Kibdelosporangium phytohabitans TaxID=860235 RepID=UPI0019F45588|nr:hypothetical protein [Kibdelosporangium phytohabitans]MBE1471393.1 hypothetical protein [Kibdelosporangium phytohabitans]